MLDGPSPRALAASCPALTIRLAARPPAWPRHQALCRRARGLRRARSVDVRRPTAASILANAGADRGAHAAASREPVESAPPVQPASASANRSPEQRFEHGADRIACRRAARCTSNAAPSSANWLSSRDSRSRRTRQISVRYAANLPWHLPGLDRRFSRPSVNRRQNPVVVKFSGILGDEPRLRPDTHVSKRLFLRSGEPLCRPTKLIVASLQLLVRRQEDKSRSGFTDGFSFTRPARITLGD